MKLIMSVCVTLALLLASPVLAGEKNGGWGFVKPKATASVHVLGLAGTACTGHCKTKAVVSESTNASASSKPSAYFDYEVSGYTGGWGFARDGLVMESGLHLSGAGAAKANKWPSTASSTVQGSIGTIGLGDKVVGEQSISGNVNGWGYDSSRKGMSGSGGSINAHQSMTASSSGGNSSAAAVGSSTQVGVSANNGS